MFIIATNRWVYCSAYKHLEVPAFVALLSPATKWKGDIGLGAVRPSVIPSVCPEIVSGA